MLSLVKDRFRRVRNVDSSAHLLVHDTTHECHRPLWRIEAHDGDAGADPTAKLVARLGELHRVSVVLVPGPAHLDSFALNPHRWSILAATHGILEELSHGEGYF